MAEKHYATDWAKAKTRDLIKEMGVGHLLPLKRPEDMKVLCFPGIDGAEIPQIYDQWRVPRQNIVGVEREPHIADTLERKNLGIQLYKGSVEEYIKRSDYLFFDCISLDYIGPINQNQINTIRSIVKKQRTNQFILHVANLMRRDQDSVDLYCLGYAFNGPVNEPIKHVYRAKEFLDKISMGERMMSEKRTGISTLIQLALNNYDERDHGRLLKFITGYDTQIKGIYNAGKDNIAEVVKIKGLEDKIMQEILADECEKAGIKEENSRVSLLWALDYALKERFFVENRGINYSYISESGAPMVGHIYLLSNPRRSINIARKIAEKAGYPGKFRLNKDKNLLEIFRLVNKFVQEEYSAQGKDGEDEKSIFLGNSSKPVLSKKRAIEEFKNGATVDELKEKYRGWENKPLPQWKAHVTMGTYGERKIEAETEEGLEMITKEEAIDLLGSGIPINEIVNAFPTSFSEHQLRAFKAHLTMGTYDNSSAEKDRPLN
jgi:hypothetical protein